MNPADAAFFPGLVDESRIFPHLEGATLQESLAEMAAGLARAGVVSDGADLTRRLVEREGMGSTGLGGGLAIPHCKLHEIGAVVLAVGVSRGGIEFGAADGQPSGSSSWFSRRPTPRLCTFRRSPGSPE